MRGRTHPHCMLTTSTHDTKRSEDVRTRLAAISELPADWRKALRRWSTINRRHKREIEGEFAPDANEEYLVYQALLGTWPLEPMDKAARATYLARIQDYLIKAIKEAKVNTSWVQPNEEWESAVRDFVAKLLRAGANRFLDNFKVLAERLAQLGMVNSLAQTVLKSTVPGMPDFYQGTEFWDFSLVDPDNRRLVDYEARGQALASLEGVDPAALLADWRDGRIKMHITHKLLNFRRQHSALFMSGSFSPMTAAGVFGDSCVASVRRHEDEALLVIVPRLTARVGFPPVGEAWRDTCLDWPAEFSGRQVRELFTGAVHTVGEDALALSDALRVLPVAAFELV